MVTIVIVPVVSAELIGFYAFDEPYLTAGDITIDLGVQPWSDAVLTGGARTITCYSCNSTEQTSNVLDLRGAKSLRGPGYVDCGSASKFDFSGSLTASAWIKTAYAGYWGTIVSRENVWSLMVPGTVRFDVPSVGSVYSNTNVNDNRWHLVAGVYEQGTGQLCIYIDGLLENSASASTGEMATGDHAVQIGAHGGKNPFQGCIDGVTIWNNALDITAINDVYINGNPGHIAHSYTPANGEVVKANIQRLAWEKCEEATACDVTWYGNDPENSSPTKIVDHELTEMVPVPQVLDCPATYYWKVDCYVPGGFRPGRLVCFNTSNFAPTVEVGADRDTWLSNGSALMNLDAEIFDDGQPAPYIVQWCVATEPNDLPAVAWSPPAGDAENVVATLTAPGKYTFSVQADDGEKRDSDALKVSVYTDACQHARSTQCTNWELLDGDLNTDCRIDLKDFACMAAGWLSDYNFDCLIQLLSNWLACNSSKCP